ncbi:MAG: hypothetical protein ACREBU_10745, partial [Nitrososphaera sp.]
MTGKRSLETAGRLALCFAFMIVLLFSTVASVMNVSAQNSTSSDTGSSSNSTSSSSSDQGTASNSTS